MLGSQFHPEFRSRPLRPHPLFRDFVGAIVARVTGELPAEVAAAIVAETPSAVAGS
jgi:hypothetical protein